MSPINKNYNISQVRPHVGLGTSPRGPSYLDTGTRRTTEQQGESTHPQSKSDQPTAADYASRPTPKKNQSINPDSIHE